MAVYYPAAKMRLYVRLEDFGTDALSTRVPSVRALDRGEPNIAPSLRRLTPADAGNRVILDDGAWKIVGLDEGSERPQATSDDKLTVLCDIRSHRLSLDLNGIRTADTFSATIDFKDMPFDPRIVRSIAVEIYLGTITPANHAASSDRTDGASTRSLLPDFDEARGISNLRFMGWADKHVLDIPSDETAVVELEGRDFLADLLDADMPPGLVLDDTVQLDEGIAKFLATLPAARGLAIRAVGISPPVPSGLRPRHARARGGAEPRRSQQAEEASYWDYALDAVEKLGFIAYVDIVSRPGRRPQPTVIIQEPRNLLGMHAVRDDDPFRAGRRVGDEILNVRRIVHGRNVETLTIERKFGKHRANGIEVRAFDPQTKSTRIARYPPDSARPRNTTGERATHVSPGNSGADSRYTVFVVADIIDQATLERRARSIFDQVARQEVAFKIATQDLASFGGDNEDPDLLDLRSGDPIELVFARQLFDPRALTATTQAELATHDPDDRVAFLVALGYPAETAAAIASRLRGEDLYPVFRTRNVRFDLDATSDQPALKVELDATNFLTIREDSAELESTPAAVSDHGADVLRGRTREREPVPEAP